MNESPAENSVNKVAWWNIGSDTPHHDTFVVDGVRALRKKLARKIEFKESTCVGAQVKSSQIQSYAYPEHADLAPDAD